jgi:hypothetical protein
VARFGEFSPIERLFEREVCNKSRKKQFWSTFLHVKTHVSILTNSGLGYLLGDFFTDSSGHPVSDEDEIKAERLSERHLHRNLIKMTLLHSTSEDYTYLRIVIYFRFLYGANPYHVEKVP